MPVIDLLKRAEIFEGLTDDEFELLSNIAGSINCATGDVIVEAGSASDELYLILNGEVDILIEPDTYGRKSSRAPIIITTLRRGQSFGEMALVSEGIRAATARCAQHDTSLAVFRRRDLMQLFDEYPRLGYRMMYNLAADLAMKVRATDLRIQERVDWSAIR